jgi:hypothetical protein
MMKARLIRKVFLWTVATCCTIVVAFYLLVLYVNRQDRPASGTVASFEELSRNRPPVADKDNGFVYLMGWPCSPRKRATGTPSGWLQSTTRLR